ncbi:style cell-cycle inhibitor 1-A-like [Zingiber officinale]|uniref:style cell-cycle inhibitor 1-A-like n=1 Tax=Zingiber officinale TaxID=94328 RepID=UPI001C4B1159|nr:style cell-cycle inhibitor 1-A-like [Zingiber officinale]
MSEKIRTSSTPALFDGSEMGNDTGSEEKSRRLHRRRSLSPSPLPSDSRDGEERSRKHRKRDGQERKIRKDESGSKEKKRDKSHKHSRSGDGKGKKSKEKHKRSKKDSDSFEELSKDDYFSKSNEFATWLKEKRGIYFSDLTSDKAREIFISFVKEWNKGNLQPQYYKGISTGPRTAHNWKIKHDE